MCKGSWGVGVAYDKDTEAEYSEQYHLSVRDIWRQLKGQSIRDFSSEERNIVPFQW